MSYGELRSKQFDKQPGPQSASPDEAGNGEGARDRASREANGKDVRGRGETFAVNRH